MATDGGNREFLPPAGPPRTNFHLFVGNVTAIWSARGVMGLSSLATSIIFLKLLKNILIFSFYYGEKSTCHTDYHRNHILV